MYEKAHAAIEQMIDKATRRLDYVHQQGGDDDAFITGLICEFVEEADRHPAGAGAAHMAFSIYKMVLMQQRIKELTDLLDMRDDALRMLFALSDD